MIITRRASNWVLTGLNIRTNFDLFSKLNTCYEPKMLNGN